MSLPTASKIERVMACPASHVLPRIEATSEYAASGQERHAALAARVTCTTRQEWSEATQRWLDGIDDDVIAHLRSAGVEVAYAHDVLWDETRVIGEDIGRAYGELRPTEIAGSADYVVSGPDYLCVVDLKTGRGEVTPPERNAQLATLALMAAQAQAWKGPVAVELLLAPEGMTPRRVMAELSPADLARHAADLVVMHGRIYEARADVEAGRTPRHVVTGSHCRYCPAQASCPERSALATQATEKPMLFRLGWQSLLAVGDAEMVLAARDALRAEADAIDQALREAAKSGPVVAGDVVCEWRTVERETIDAAKAWAVLSEAYGPDAARAAMTLETSKAGVERGVTAAIAAGALVVGKKKDVVAAALASLRAAGAMTKKSTERYEEHKR